MDGLRTSLRVLVVMLAAAWLALLLAAHRLDALEARVAHLEGNKR